MIIGYLTESNRRYSLPTIDKMYTFRTIRNDRQFVCPGLSMIIIILCIGIKVWFFFFLLFSTKTSIFDETHKFDWHDVVMFMLIGIYTFIRNQCIIYYLLNSWAGWISASFSHLVVIVVVFSISFAFVLTHSMSLTRFHGRVDTLLICVNVYTCNIYVFWFHFNFGFINNHVRWD